MGMQPENVELFRRSVEAVNERDLDSFLRLMNENVESVSRIVAIEGGLRGHAGVRRWWENWFDSFPDYMIEIVEAQEIGSVVLAALRAVGHGSGSALPFEDTVWHASQWRSGKCVWWRVFNTQAEAVDAIELRR